MFKRAMIFFIGLFLITGCSSLELGYKLRSSQDTTERIAVLPFENFTNDPVAGERIRRMVIQELVLRGFFVIESGEVNKVLVEKGVTNLSLLGSRELEEVGEKLGVKYLIKGGVFSYEMQRFSDVVYPSVAIQVNLIDVSTGKVVRSTYRTEGGPSLGSLYFGMEPEALSEVAKKVVRKALNDLF